MASSHNRRVFRNLSLPVWRFVFRLCIILCMSTVTQLPNRQTDVRAMVAGEVRAWMGRRGITQTALSTGVGIGQSQISKRLAGKIPFDIDELSRIADFLDIELVVLLGGTPSHGGPDGGGSMTTHGYTYPNAA